MTEVIILAAGRGTRMGSDLPKVLTPLAGRPMISYLLDSILEFDKNIQPVIVVSPEGKKHIEEALLGYNFKIAIQEQALGTGHAVLSAKDKISSQANKVLVLYGDHPFISSNSISKLLSVHDDNLSLMSVELEDFSNWRKNFYHWGRLYRDEDGNLERIIEFKDASDSEKEIKEVNPAIFCFDSKWLWDNIAKLKNNNKQGEYYLTDLIKTAFDLGTIVKTTPIEAKEGVGINTPEELDIVEKIILDMLNK
ncbi:MAG: NTP transferase domain-containing protein [Candidatus Pacebacteria bacterium]|nr:NTP transferase domain-containing protein [Candidatus Paceibacterota bacterium]